MTIDWRTLPSLSALRAFDAVARARGFSGAARMLNVTHAAISQQVRGLERDLGVVLTQRAGRSIALTEAGEVLARGLADGFEGIQSAVAGVKAREARRGLRVATTPFIVDAVVMPRLAEFWQAHPGVEIALQPSIRYVDLVAEGLDLAIRAGKRGTVWPGMDVRLLAPSRWVVVGTPDLMADGETDPLKLPWIWTDEMPGEIKVLKEAGVDIDKLTKVDVGSSMLHWHAARRGLGLTLASEHVAREELASGRLVEFDLPGLETADGYYAVTPKGPRRQIVDEFIDFLESIF